MYWLALRTILYKKGRILITLVGITFSCLLTLTQVALFLGMMGNATAVIRHTDADIWITSKNTQSFDFSNAFPEQRINRVSSFDEVLWAKKLILTWGFLKLANGAQEQIQIIGFDPSTGTGGPWQLAVGAPSDVKGGPYMIADKTSAPRLGALNVGSTWELNTKRFKLVGLSDGIKSFTTAPMVFMSYERAQSLMASANAFDSRQTTFIVAKLKYPEARAAVVTALKNSLKDNDVYTRNEFILKTVMYWTVQTGLGMALFLMAVLGLVIGGAIVGQTIYAYTMEHRQEFGTLKAIGARNSDIYRIILSQAALSGTVGYGVGLAVIMWSRQQLEEYGVTLYFSRELIGILFIVVLLTCFASALVSVRQVRKLDPVIVFRE
jgi:putative ABC transport system permease protein